jgi:hypothetical protein
MIPDELRKTAVIVDAIGRAIFSRGYVKDTVAWISERSGSWRVAWIMPALKLQKLLNTPDYHLPLNPKYVDHVLSRLLGVRETHFKYDYDVVAGDFLPKMTDMVRGADPAYEEQNDLGITFIPEPGYPYPCEGGSYYSVVKKKLIECKRPPWLIERIVDESRGIDSPGADLCRFLEIDAEPPMGATIGRYGDRADDVFMVTHAMGSLAGMTRFGDWESNAQNVNDCGGLLFPSLAVGPIPATNFGLAVLVADVGLVLSSLSPYRGRGAHPLAHVYNTDVWTGRTSEFLQAGAISAFEQLHGHSDYVYTYDLHVWPLGAPLGSELSGPAADASAIEKVPELIRELKQRFRVWRRGLTPEKYEHIHSAHGLEKARYGYLEAKINAVVPMSEFPLAVVPTELEAGFARFLKLTGFTGDLLTVELPAEVRDVMDENWNPPGVTWERREAIRTWAWTEYGWNVLDRVMAYDGPSGREVVLHREKRRVP